MYRGSAHNAARKPRTSQYAIVTFRLIAVTMNIAFYAEKRGHIALLMFNNSRTPLPIFLKLCPHIGPKAAEEPY